MLTSEQGLQRTPLSGASLDPRSRQELEVLCNTYCERTGAQRHDADDEAGPSGRAFPDDSKEADLHSWCTAQGLEARVFPATFGDGGLRGVQAKSDLRPGDVAVSLPTSCLISYKTARDSDL
eukprot:scaffold13080_cov18-Tisochrysis_lutea.AAC.1